MKRFTSTALLAALAVSPVASAHTASDTLLPSLWGGMIHPLIGLDHLLILASMGMLAHFQTSTSNKKWTTQYLTKLSVVLVAMAAGLFLGHLFGDFAMMETVIVLSLFVPAAALFLHYDQTLISRVISAVALAGVAVHGWAHGVELAGASIWGFGLGMLGGSALAFVVGSLLARLLPKTLVALAVSGSGFLILLAA
jgi:urease accessory protein